MPEILDPPKPAAASTTTPAPAPAAAPAATPTAPPSDDNPYSEVDAAFTKAGIAEGTPKPKDTPPDKGAPSPKPDKTAAPPPKVPTAQDKAPGVPKELRAELDRVKGELKTKSESYTALEAKIKDFEARGKDTTVLTERLTKMEQDMESLRAENRALKQESSPEFKKKYDEPFNRLADRAKNVIEQIQIEDPETGTVKAATWDDFTKLYNQGEFIATKEAKRLFGEDGATVAMRYYTELHRLDDDRKIALQEEKAQWKEKQTAEEANRVKSQEEINAFWTKANAELSEKVEDYHDSPDDKELVEARNKALAIFDAQPKTLKERIIKDAHNRQRVAAFPVLKMRLARALKELADLKTENEGLKEKPPGKATRPGGTGGAKPEESFEDYVRKTVTG
jgi:hypothetical protein